MTFDFNAALADAAKRREKAEQLAKEGREKEITQLVGEIVYTINTAANSEVSDPRPLLNHVKSTLDGTAVATSPSPQLQQEISDLRTANTQLTSENDQLSQTVQNATDPQVVSDLRQRISTLQTENTNLITENGSLKTENQDLKTGKGRLETELRNAQASLATSQQEVQRLQGQLNPTSQSPAPVKKTAATPQPRAAARPAPAPAAPPASPVPAKKAVATPATPAPQPRTFGARIKAAAMKVAANLD